MNTNKLLVAFFVILIIVFLGEVGFILFTNKLPFALNNSKSGQIVTPEPKANSQRYLSNENQAIDPDLLENLANIKDDILTTSELKNNYNGIIKDVEIKDGLTLYLKGNKNNVNRLHFTQSQLSLINVIKYREEADPEPAKIEDLKAGQNILIEENLDLLQDLTNSATGIRILIYSDL